MCSKSINYNNFHGHQLKQLRWWLSWRLWLLLRLLLTPIPLLLQRYPIQLSYDFFLFSSAEFIHGISLRKKHQQKLWKLLKRLWRQPLRRSQVHYCQAFKTQTDTPSLRGAYGDGEQPCSSNGNQV